MNTTIKSGRFTSDGTAVQLDLGFIPDWIRVINETAVAQAALDLAFDFYFQRGMTNGQGLVWTKLGAVANDPLTAGQLAANTGFFLLDTSDRTPGARFAVTGVSAANPPVVLTATTPNLGDIVRLDTLDNQGQISGLEFTVTAVNPGVSFTIGNINMVASVASTAGFYRTIPFDPIYYPRNRSITYISSEVNPRIYLSVTHTYVVGQRLTLRFPGGEAIWGDYARLDGVTGTVIAINQARNAVIGNEPNNAGVPNNVVLDIDTTGFTLWNASFGVATRAYPDVAQVPFTPAQTVPAGENIAVARNLGVNEFGARYRNTAILGVTLGGGAIGNPTPSAGPAGAFNDNTLVGDIMYWQAGLNFSVDNQ